MATKSFDLGNFAYQAGPMIWGSLQHGAGMTTVKTAAPCVVAQDMPETDHVMDTRGRLTNANLTNGQGEAYNMDDAGNRVSVVTT